jgi:hypothetical protein
MTYKELIEDVIMDLDESMGDTSVVERVKKYINRGYKELAKREGLEKTKVTEVSDGKIKKPSDLIKLYGVRSEDGEIPCTLNGKYIEIDFEGEVELSYSYIPEALVEMEDETLTNPGNDEFIVTYAKYLFCMSDGLEDMGAYYKAQIDNFRPVTQAKIVKVADVWR